MNDDFMDAIREAMRYSSSSKLETVLLIFIQNKGNCYGIACSLDNCPFKDTCKSIILHGNLEDMKQYRYKKSIELFLEKHSIEELVELLV